MDFWQAQRLSLKSLGILKMFKLILAFFVATTPFVKYTTPAPKAKVAHLSGVVDQYSLEVFDREMQEASKLPGTLTIIIDSPGGSYSDGQEMIKILEKEKARGTKIVCVVPDHAHSMAFNFFTRCPIRVAARKAVFVAHKVALGWLPPGPVRYTGPVLMRIAKQLYRLDRPFRKANAKAMHLSFKQYDKAAAKDRMWSAKELKRLHYLTYEN